MLNLKSLSLLSLAVMLASPLLAQEHLLAIPQPIGQERVFSAPGSVVPMVPEAQFSEPFHGEIVPGPVYVDSAPEPLFTRVKYVDKREMHPCAVKKIIRVNDPCASKDACDSCGPQCVFIEICVPPCDCEEDIRCRRNGNRVRYDYGKYKVDVRIRKGYIVVDYQK